MIIKHCSSFPVLIVRLIVGEISPDGGVFYQVKDKDSEFFFTVKRRIANQIKAGDALILICIPFENLESAKEVLFLGRKQGIRTDILIEQGTSWNELYEKTGAWLT